MSLIIKAFCKAHFGQEPDRIQTPGGRRRKTIIVEYGPDLYVVSRRKTVARARLEEQVLKALAPTGHVPGFVARSERYLVQEYVPGQRLTQALETASAQQQQYLVDLALQTLAQLQSAAALTGLNDQVPDIGKRKELEAGLLTRPARIAAILDIAAPRFDHAAFRRDFAAGSAGFVKWDARPGNALVRPDGSVCWFDWEHSGRYAPQADPAWFLADEWCPDFGEDPAFAGFAPKGLANSPAFLSFAILHSCHRLWLILDRKGSGRWWSYVSCLENDYIGVTAQHVERICTRATRWASQLEGAEEFQTFFAEVKRKATETDSQRCAIGSKAGAG
jgi:aminoglycoside phosphotransferase (APT) family kinase protein